MSAHMHRKSTRTHTDGQTYLQQLVGQIGLNQPVVHGDVEQLVLRPLGQAENLLKLRANHIVSFVQDVNFAVATAEHQLSPCLLT